jgi:hypothetical protein
VTVTRYFCDRCREPIATGRAVLTIEAGSVPLPWPTSPATGRPTIELCGSCLDALITWLRHGAEVPSELQEAVT